MGKTVNGPSFAASIVLNPEWEGTPEGDVMLNLVRGCFKQFHGGTWPVADFLLNLHNSGRPLSLSLLCSQTTSELFGLAIEALKIRRKNGSEPHEYFVNGDKVIQALAHLYKRTGDES